MLEDLDAVDWSRLSHAYGEATNVPDMLRGLASDDRDVRENALDGLFWTIHHQGTIYDATAPAVPFLLELVRSPEVRDRDRILDLLAAIAGGCGYLQAHQTLESPQKRQTEQFQQELAEERGWQQAVRDALWRGWPLFLDLLGSDEEAIRKQTLRVLGRLLEQPRSDLGPVLDKLVACLEDTSHPEKPGILLQLGEAARFHADPLESWRAALDHHERDIQLSNMSDLRESQDQGTGPACTKQSAADRLHGHEALATLWSHWPVFEGLAESPDPAVREGVLFLQAMLLRFGDTAAPAGLVPQTLPVLSSRWLRRLQESAEEQEQADLLFALAAVASHDPQVPEVIRRVLQAARSPLVGYVTALKLVDLTGEVDDRGLDWLLEVHRGSREVYDRLQAMPRWEPYWASPRLERLGPAVVERRLPAFIDMVRSTGKGLGASGQARELLRLAFGGKKLPPQATGADLTEAQRELLLAAADNGHFWTNLANDRLELHRLLGLPDDRRDLRRFLARPGEPVSRPRNDPEDALVQFERLVASQLPFEKGVTPYHGEEGDTRAPFHRIQEGVAEMNRISEGYRPRDRPTIRRLAPRGHACDVLLALLPLCPNLQDLDLSYGEATDAALHHLARLLHLERLDLSGNWITDAGLPHLAGLMELRELGLWRTDITDAGLRHLAGLVHLRKLNLQGTRIQGGGLAFLCEARGLEVLWLTGDTLSDDAALAVAAFRSLKELSIGGGRFTGRGLGAWQGLTSLKELTLQGPLSPPDLQDLAALSALEKLRLVGKGIGSEHVRALPALPGLRSLSLGHTGITDAALDRLERFPALERLDLSWTGVMDAMQPYLLRVPGLRWVGLYRTGVTDGVVEQLRRALPKTHFGR